MFKKEKIMILQILAVIIAISAFITSASGIIFQNIYKPIVSSKGMPFVYSQDLISVTAAILLLVITIFWKKENMKLDIFRIGIIGYLFYAYGQYVIGTMYNYFYLLYLSIFGFSIFYFIYAFTSIEYKKLEFKIPKSLQIITAIYCALIPVIFAPQWIFSIYQFIQINSRPGINDVFSYNYSVYILDLCFVLPVCVITSVLLFQKKISGLLLGGILQIKGFTLLSFVALGNLFRPLFLQNIDIVNTVLYTIVSILCLILSILYFIYSEVKKTDERLL